jgi:hypothetical protein
MRRFIISMLYIQKSRPPHFWLHKNGRTNDNQKHQWPSWMSLHGALCLEIGDGPIVEAQSVNAETTIEVLEKFIRQNPTRWQEHVFWAIPNIIMPQSYKTVLQIMADS